MMDIILLSTPKAVYNADKAKKKICVFTVTRPTLIFASDPMHFYTEFG
jgi:hypothetical protein